MILLFIKCPIILGNTDLFPFLEKFIKSLFCRVTLLLSICFTLGLPIDLNLCHRMTWKYVTYCMLTCAKCHCSWQSALHAMWYYSKSLKKQILPMPAVCLNVTLVLRSKGNVTQNPCK